MFERAAHVRVAALLEALDEQHLKACACAFGGGTRIALELGEFRESRNVDFLTSDPAGFAALRMLVRDRGCAALFTAAGRAHCAFPREAKVDAYAVRFPVLVDGVSIRTEFIHEARIVLEPAARVPWTPVPVLTVADCFAEKLLANSDRWPDDSVLSRDLIDLAALSARHGAIPPEAFLKAEAAYHAAVRADLQKAAARFTASERHRAQCLDALDIALDLRAALLPIIARWAASGG